VLLILFVCRVYEWTTLVARERSSLLSSVAHVNSIFFIICMTRAGHLAASWRPAANQRACEPYTQTIYACRATDRLSINQWKQTRGGVRFTGRQIFNGATRGKHEYSSI